MFLTGIHWVLILCTIFTLQDLCHYHRVENRIHFGGWEQLFVSYMHLPEELLQISVGWPYKNSLCFIYLHYTSLELVMYLSPVSINTMQQPEFIRVVPL